MVSSRRKKITVASLVTGVMLGTAGLGWFWSQHTQKVEMKDGAILHAWCWSFDTIKDNLPAIKKAGYTSIQTSPINQVVEGENGSKALTNWYYHYQPTDYTIGNYQLGTEADFKALTKEADKYGLHIIVDAVVNHTTSDVAAVSPKIKALGKWTHGNEGIKDFGDRYQLTQKSLLGLYDLNTQNKAVQEYLLAYLKRAVADGADGFRYDAAKHIELPKEYGSDFWSVILNNGAQFQYGEILQGSTSKEADYAKLMGVTASDYGEFIRNSLRQEEAYAEDLMDFQAPGVPEDRLVTWVETHDTYANDNGESTNLTDQDIILGWSLIASRKEGAPLFYSRPVGGGGQNDRFPGQSEIGDAGSDLFKNKTIVAINHFRNTMNGRDEYLHNIGDDQGLVMIERGGKGAIITNLASENKTFSTSTKLADGSYKDAVSGKVYKVSGKTLKGKLPKKSVLVLLPA
ncbi:alpha-amylase family glycosyl hydrolase [Streptococcus dysgalactiae]|uniref:Alpha-amylase n=1 Tax=Streptococcus dysgalactiae subsp. dysgalactiae TaxID=99822 RepID=A0A9X7S139_STRDY|nr:alpha-amylase family glycosyl hydrolase [Streptococcus dysgalactiae]MSU87845.1 alpha-amylase [Streptococcus dysgalactiae subsp. dysgalactiae]QGG97736.1 alpha-amylase [Streptococcus dysgalactiae subsp. dysgalactiae]QGH01376.1 alpha-amylase [Streptococcus dysgalactiae subsp. dysgalactiae]